MLLLGFTVLLVVVGPGIWGARVLLVLDPIGFVVFEYDFDVEDRNVVVLVLMDGVVVGTGVGGLFGSMASVIPVTNGKISLNSNYITEIIDGYYAKSKKLTLLIRISVLGTLFKAKLDRVVEKKNYEKSSSTFLIILNTFKSTKCYF